MKTEQHNEGPVTVITIGGPLVEEEVASLNSLVRGLLQQGRRWILLDLSSVPFVGSAAMEMLLELTAESARRGGSLKVGGVSEIVRDAFIATRLTRSLELYSERAAARRAFH